MSLFPNAKEDSARAKAPLWLAKDCIRAEIDRLTENVLKKMQASADKVLAEFANLGFSDPAAVTWQPGELDSAGNPTQPGQLKPLYEMPQEVRRTIRSIEHDGRKVKIKFWDKNPPLTNLGRHHNLIGPDVNVNVSVSFAERLKRAQEKRLKSSSPDRSVRPNG